MEEIKLRETVIRAFMKGDRHAIYNVTTIETIILQVRMITELISLASLAAHKDMFDTASRRFRNHWHPAKIFRDLESLNPDFYPVPIEERPGSIKEAKADLVDSTKDTLSKEELIRVHGRCGNVLHATNPYRRKHDYDALLSEVNTWMTKIVNLLSVHKIKLFNSDQFHLVKMRVGDEGHVHMYTFQPVN